MSTRASKQHLNVKLSPSFAYLAVAVTVHCGVLLCGALLPAQWWVRVALVLGALLHGLFWRLHWRSVVSVQALHFHQGRLDVEIKNTLQAARQFELHLVHPRLLLLTFRLVQKRYWIPIFSGCLHPDDLRRLCILSRFRPTET